MRISDWSSDVCSSDLGLRHTSRNGIKEYRRDALPNALCRFDRAPVLNLLEHVVDDRWRQIRDRNFPDLGENVPFEAAKHIGGMDRRPLRLRHLVPLSGDTFERVSDRKSTRLNSSP